MGSYTPDHYRVLGVPVQADAAAIKDAYRRLSRVYHPDRHGGSQRATQCFQLIASAWTELSDSQRRALYDRTLVLRDPLRLVDDPRAGRALDVLDQVVGRLRRRPAALPAAGRGRDLRVRHGLPFAVAALGGRVAVAAEYPSSCTTCQGQGTTAPAQNPPCHVCQGSGQIRHGVRRESAVCGFCDGRGAVLLAPCAACHGDGHVLVRRLVDVDVPPRCRDGAVLRVRGGGEAAAGAGSTGDLLVDVTVDAHPLLQAEGDDLVCRVPITWSEALEGATLTVPTLQGLQRLVLPPGSSSGRELRIAGHGLPIVRNGRPTAQRGTLRVVVQVDVPQQPSAALRAAVDATPRQHYAKAEAYAQALAALAAVDPSP